MAAFALRLRVLTTLLAVSALAPAHAQESAGKTTADLRAACERNEITCGAYLEGVADTLTAVGSRGDLRGICSNPHYTRDQLRRAFLSWAPENDYLQTKHMNAGAESFLQSLWPCTDEPKR